eukprot:8179059-Ditylum_brightwellii.AAC.1
MPLHHACADEASLGRISALSNTWVDGPKGVAPFEVLSTLLDIWPDAVNEKDKNGETPLHIACIDAPLEVISLLLNMWLRFKENRKGGAQLDLKEYASISTTEDAQKIFSYAFMLSGNKTENHRLNKIMAFFVSTKLWNGIEFCFDKYPKFVKTLEPDTIIMADIRFMVGRYFRLTTMWKVICAEQDLLGGV